MSQDKHAPPWEGRTPENTQVFFQPDNTQYGIVELVDWFFTKNEHDQLCIAHLTHPSKERGLAKYVRVEDDRLRFFDREKPLDGCNPDKHSNCISIGRRLS